VTLCLGLGVWQVQRLHWKLALIVQREAAVAAPAVPPPQTRTEAEAMAFRHVADQGTLLNDKEILVAAISPGGRGGYDVLTPLREPAGRIVFIDRGFVSTELKDPASRSAGEPSGAVHIMGLLRVPPAQPPSWFVPANHPERSEWFWIDLPAMAAADRLDDVAPFVIDADATPNPGGWPQGGATPLQLPNNHLQYAITWFSLAAAALVIYVLYHRRNPGPR
jgi:surfeit locus 1 family protein